MIYSHAVQSIATILLILTSFFDFGVMKNKKYFHFSWELFFKYFSFFRKPAFIGLSLVFFYTLVPCWNSLDPEYHSQKILIKLPFFLLPAAFLTFNHTIRRRIPLLFEGMLVLFAFQAVIIFLSNNPFESQFIDTLGVGQSIETPGHHIAFSILTAFCLLGNIYFLLFERFRRGKLMVLKLLFVATTIGFMHTLAVRSGILVLYVGTTTLFAFWIFQNKKIGLGLAAMASIVLLPILMYKTSEAFRQKVHYMKYDYEQFRAGKGADYADSGRLVSFIVGTRLAVENPILGTGLCNIRPMVKQNLDEFHAGYPEHLTPHNQFLFTQVSSGIIGSFCLLLGFFLPFLYKQKWNHPFIGMLMISFFALFMIEHTLETSVGVGLYLFYLMIGLTWLSPILKKQTDN